MITFRITLDTMTLLILGLVLVACATTTEPVGEAEGPTSSTVEPTDVQLPPTSQPPPVATSTPEMALPDLGPAPEIANEVWLNTDRPLSLASLRGQVVLVEFWTFG